MEMRALIALLYIAIMWLSLTALSMSESYEVYRVETTYVASGSGEISEELLSKTFLLAPSIEGWQELINFTLYVDGRREKAYVKEDTQGNSYVALKQGIKFSGRTNLTLVQYVRVFNGYSRRQYTPSQGLKEGPGDRRYISLKGFWNCSYGGATLADLEKLSEKLGRGESIDYIYRVVDWASKNTKYVLGIKGGGVMCPAEFYVKREGACGDIHVFLAAMLRMRKIPSYVYYSYIYVGGHNLTLAGDDVRVEMLNVLPHMFLMVGDSGKWFPVDLTYHSSMGGGIGDFISGAGANTKSNVIVLYRVVDENPNDYLMVYFPSNNSKIDLRIKVEKVGYSRPRVADNWFFIALIAAAVLLAIILFESSPTEGADYV